MSEALILNLMFAALYIWAGRIFFLLWRDSKERKKRGTRPWDDLGVTYLPQKTSEPVGDDLTVRESY